MSFELKPHQLRCVQAYEDLRASGDRFRRCITSSTGTGKSLVMTSIAESEVSKGGRVVLYSIRRLLTEQFIKQLQRDGVPFGCRAAEFDEHVDDSAPVQICSMQTELARVLRKRKKQGLEGDIARRQFPLPRASLVILDECHMVKADTAVQVVGEHYELGADVIGFSATPFGCGHMFDPGGLIFGADVSEGRESGLLVPCYFKTVPEMDTSQIEKVKTVNGDWSENDIRKYCWTQAIYGYVFESMVEFNPEMRPFFLFAPGVEESVGFESHFRQRGVRIAHIDAVDVVLDGKRYPSNRDVRRSILKEHEEGSIKGLTNRFVLKEAVDAPWCEFLSLAVPFGSLVSYLQICGRVLRASPKTGKTFCTCLDHGGCLDDKTEVLTKRGWVGCDGIRDDDMVAGFDRNSCEISWQPIISRYDRVCENGEIFYLTNGRQHDIRITGNHRILNSWRKMENGSLFWPKSYSLDRVDAVCEKNGRFRIPISGVQNFRGVELSDAQLEFIGWFLSDGTRAGKREEVSISQSEHQPQISDLRKCLDACGFDYREWKSSKNSGSFKTNSMSIKFFIPKGNSINRPRSGWLPLSGYLDKELSPLLDEMTVHQFECLLRGLHLGDGAKSKNKYLGKSYKILTGNLRFAERLQSAAVRRGWKCNIYVRKGLDGRKDDRGISVNDAYWMNMQKKDFLSLHGSGTVIGPGVSKFTTESAAGCRVWCVANPLETIVTRRNGKVAIIGNSYWRFGSPNADRHHIFAEYFDDPDGARIAKEARLEAIRQEKEECPISCPKCGSVQLAMKTGLCYNCNHDLRGKTKRFVIQRDGKLVEVTGLPVKPRKQVKSPDMMDAWARAYWASKRKGGKLYGHTFAQLRGMIASGNFGGFEHLRGQWVAPGVALTPKDPATWFRKTCDVPSMLLNQ